MRYALRSFAHPIVPLRYKADTLFPKLLHKFLAPTHPRCRRCSKRTPASRTGHDHLHFTGAAKGRPPERQRAQRNTAADVVRIDSKLPGGYYKRAWGSSTPTETNYLKYIDEIRLK